MADLHENKAKNKHKIKLGLRLGGDEYKLNLGHKKEDVQNEN